MRPALPLCLLSATALASCELFDPALYQQLADGGVVVDAGAPADAAGARDAGSGGSGGSDGALPPGDGAGLGGALCGRAAPASLCPGSYVFCDGFEDESDGNFSHWSTWFADNLSGAGANLGTALTVAGAPVCLGQHALHGTVVGRNQEAVVIRDFSGWPNPLHLRFFVYINQHTSTMGLVELRNSNGDFTSLFVDPPDVGGSTSRFGLETSFMSALGHLGAPLVLDHQRWLCLELTLRLDAQSGEAQLAIDGSPVGALTGVPTAASSTPMDRMALGPIAEASGGLLATDDVLIDEVAVSAAPIGCF
jgi:hypothetical protein